MCYFTSGCGLHRVVTAICLPPLNHHYSDAAADDVLGCMHLLRLCLSCLLNNKVFFGRDSRGGGGGNILPNTSSLILPA